MEPLALPSSPSVQALLSDPRLWRAASLGRHSRPTLPSGHAALNAELPGGGWPVGDLVEILQSPACLAEWQLLGPALRLALRQAEPSPRASGARATRPLVLINPPHAPHLPGLLALDLPVDRLVWVAPEASPNLQSPQALWATEQVLRSGTGAITLAWLPQARPEHLRRLQSAASDQGSTIFVLRPLQAQQQASAAPLRVLLQYSDQGQVQLRLIKRRGPAHEHWLQLNTLPAGLAPHLPSQGWAGPSKPLGHPTHPTPSVIAALDTGSPHAPQPALARAAAARPQHTPSIAH